MMEYFIKAFEVKLDSWGMSVDSSYLAYGVAIVMVLLFALVVDLIARKVLIKLLERLASKTKNRIDDKLMERGAIKSVIHIVPAIIVYFFAGAFGFLEIAIEKVMLTYIALNILRVISISIDVMVEVYNSYDFSKGTPIKGIMQIVKMVMVVLFAGFLIVLYIGNTTASIVFGSIGGLSAIILLIFKDSILGFVAGIQLSTGHLLKIGDWREMTKYGADGEVVDISLTKITVRNWDKTYTAIPAYRFLEDSFKNWEGMTDSGGRRIKRCINVDAGTVGFLTKEQLLDLSEFELLKDYFKDKLDLVEGYDVDSAIRNNMRNLTNLGTFRAYIEEYILNNENINDKNFTAMVRQRSASDKGIPLEIYCFTNKTAWVEYEKIQADIFDHVYAVAPYFGLRLYQSPSGHDIQKAIVNRI